MFFFWGMMQPYVCVVYTLRICKENEESRVREPNLRWCCSCPLSHYTSIQETEIQPGKKKIEEEEKETIELKIDIEKMKIRFIVPQKYDV